MAKLSFNAVSGEIVDECQVYEFSIFKSLADPCPQTITLDEFVEMIQGGEFSDEIKRLRAEQDEDRQKAIKRTLPCVTVSGVFSGGHHSTNLASHSGLICLDFDADQNAALAGMADHWRDKLAEDQFVKHAFVSARGNGVAAICRIEPDNHAMAFDALAVYFKKEHGLNVDKACRDVTRLRFMN